jgi:SAM-dependent methyltransferase
MGSPILGLSSHRAQDYAGAHHSLAEAYPNFLRDAPTEAVEALVAVRAAYGRKRFERSYGEILRVEVGGGEAIEIVADGGSVWDVQPFPTDEEVKILGAFEERLGELVADGDRDGVEVLLAPLRGRQVPASIWRRIVRVATEHPEVLAEKVAPLLGDHEVLCDPTLGAPVGQFLSAAFAGLDAELRERIERAITDIPARWEAENPEQPEAAAIGGRRRDRALGSLQPEDLADAGLRERLEEMIAAEAVPDNDERVFEIGDGGGYGERESLAHQGVDFSVAANERLLDLSAPVSEFYAEHLNSIPKREDIEAVIDPLGELLDALPKAERDGASNLMLSRSYTRVVQAAEVIARDTSLPADDPVRQLVLQILLEAARHPEPPADEESDEKFDESPGWSPAPRIEAAIGILSLAREDASATAEVLDAIDALRRDGACRVRYQVARHLGRLQFSAPERALKMVEATAAEESSTAVLRAVLSPLSFFLRDEPERLREIIEEIYGRTSAVASGAQELRRSCAGLICDL